MWSRRTAPLEGRLDPSPTRVGTPVKNPRKGFLRWIRPVWRTGGDNEAWIYHPTCSETLIYATAPFDGYIPP